MTPARSEYNRRIAIEARIEKWFPVAAGVVVMALWVIRVVTM